MEGTLSQPYVFAAAVYAGMALGCVYSLLRALRRALGDGGAVRVAADVLFGVICTAAAAALMYAAHDMEIKLYCAAAMGIGAALWLASVAPLAKYVYCKFSRGRVDKGEKKSSNSSRR